ncbi:hypothetical protein [Nostoc sp. UHCC 0302]|uniref:hypothetical protein n=1 Tax=Nostoc sp. UHCC 0302 TaxID=3134896 RepID=UPI00311CA834
MTTSQAVCSCTVKDNSPDVGDMIAAIAQFSTLFHGSIPRTQQQPHLSIPWDTNSAAIRLTSLRS